MADVIKKNFLDKEAVPLENKEKLDDFVMNNTGIHKAAKQTTALNHELKKLKEISEDVQREKQIIDVLPHITWTASENGHIEFFNKRWYEYTGIINAHDLNKDWWNTIFEEDLLKMKSFWKEIIHEGKSAGIKVRLKTIIEGLPRWHEISMVPINNEEGRGVKWIGTATDIHSQIVQTKRLNDKNTELLAVNHYLDLVLHSIAHDLRAPVANLKAIIEILHKASDNERNRLIQNMDLIISKMDDVIIGLVKVMDIQGDNGIFSYGLKVREIIQDVINNEQERLCNAQAQIKIQVTKDLKINYVREFLKVIILNLIRNAIDFRSQHEIPEIIIKAVRVDDDFVKISVKDNGIGIDMFKNKDKVFKPFVRLSARSKGMGLGLHIIAVMVERNGGRVEVESVMEEGSEFFIFLREYD